MQNERFLQKICTGYKQNTTRREAGDPSLPAWASSVGDASFLCAGKTTRSCARMHPSRGAREEPSSVRCHCRKRSHAPRRPLSPCWQRDGAKCGHSDNSVQRHIPQRCMRSHARGARGRKDADGVHSRGRPSRVRLRLFRPISGGCRCCTTKAAIGGGAWTVPAGSPPRGPRAPLGPLTGLGCVAYPRTARLSPKHTTASLGARNRRAATAPSDAAAAADIDCCAALGGDPGGAPQRPNSRPGFSAAREKKAAAQNWIKSDAGCPLQPPPLAASTFYSQGAGAGGKKVFRVCRARDVVDLKRSRQRLRF